MVRLIDTSGNFFAKKDVFIEKHNWIREVVWRKEKFVWELASYLRNKVGVLIRCLHSSVGLLFTNG